MWPRKKLYNNCPITIEILGDTRMPDSLTSDAIEVAFGAGLGKVLDERLGEVTEGEKNQPMTLVKLRERANLTQMKLAIAIGVSLTTISDWENGKSEPRLKHIKLLLKILSCSFDELAEGFDQAKRRVAEHAQAS